MPYKLLDADKVAETVVKLSQRIEERFPEAGLARMCRELDDDVVLAAVNEVETLTTGLSRKIWQKLMILETTVVARDADQAPRTTDATPHFTPTAAPQS